MPFRSLFQTPEQGYWENCCRVPKTMTIIPPVPVEYEAFIHRCGWILYVHKPTKQRSWMHPVKLAQLEAKGLKGPGKYGPEMWIFEPNVNYGGHYCVDYEYPPFGEIRIASRPSCWDFKEIDRVGYDAWKKQMLAKAAEPDEKQAIKKHEFGSVVTQEEKDNAEGLLAKHMDPEWRKEFSRVRRQILEEQGLWEIEREVDNNHVTDGFEGKQGDHES